MARQITLPIRGIDFPNRKGPTRRFALELLQPGDPVELRPEPKNPADPNAIAIFTAEDVQLGYLPAERAPFVGLQISRGDDVSAIFQGRTATGAFLRIAFGGEKPEIPPASASQPIDQDWWPDPEYPDDFR
jgi:hypothetical protein